MFLHDRNLIFFEHPEKRNDEKENNFEGRKCVRNRRGWIYLDRGTVLTNIVLSRLPTPSSAELPKFFHSSDVKKFRQQCFPGKLPEVPQAHLTSPKFSLCIHPLYPFIRCRLFVVDFSCFSLHSLSFFSFFLSSVDNHSTGNVRHGLQAANGANARECMAPGAIKAWLDFFPPNIKLLLRCKMVE